MKTFSGLIIVLAGLVLLAIQVLPIETTGRTPAADQAAPTQAPPEGEKTGGESQPADPAPLTQAVQDTVLLSKASLPILKDTTAAVDFISYSSDQRSALVYLALVDPVEGSIIGSEPILAVAHAVPELESGWSVVIQGDPLFTASLAALPDELLNDDLRLRFLSEDKAEPKAVTATYGGYLLPWAAGLEKRLSMGANHVSCPSTCTYAFDFADGTMFPLLASKGGSVYHWKDTCPNFETTCTNSLTIQDRSTNPYTYQIYLHLAQNSIPTALKQVGAGVVQGQYIGNVDDTGYSSGHHVHFMVVTNPVLGYSGYMWGTSVDITFRDVSINWDAATQGGRPCRLSDVGYGHCVEYQTEYISGNVGSNPPTGGLTGPPYGTQVNTPVIAVSGWGQDDLAVTKLQMLANFDGVWREVGPGQLANPFAFNLDLCADLIPDGPVTLALRVYDYEGNFTFLPIDPRPIFKKYTCAAPPAPPTCTPSADQVALFSEADFGGVCQVLGLGSYASGSLLGAVGGDNTASIKVGQNVSASLFWADNFMRRSESLTSSYPSGTLLDRNLADNLISANTLSALKVQTRTTTPAAPVLYPASVSKQLGTNPTSVDSIVLSWTGGGGATKFKAELYYGAVDGSPERSFGYTTDQSWSIGNLPAGNYNWQVMGRVAEYSANPTPYYSAWSTGSFTVDPASLPVQAPLPTPYSDSMESGSNGWTASGLWRQAGIPFGGGTTTAWIFNNGSDYADGSIRAGDLTSPPISLPASPAIRYLRVSYRTQTESPQVFFDQRRVQISADGGPFQDLPVQPLSDDSMNAWLESGPISLASYAGKTIRVRFHFDIVDPNWNGYTGWAVDNVTVNDTPGAAPEIPANNSPQNAPDLAYDSPIAAVISPEGDIDYYRISASAGDVIRADVTAGGLNPPSPLDPVLTLLDADGRSVLAENDDVIPGTNSDSSLSYLIHTTGTYYLKVKAWNHPGVGGAGYQYQIMAHQQADITPPQASLDYPPGGGYMPPALFSLSASALDETGGSGMKHVQFFWHTSDWANGTWQLIGTDTLAADGWTAPFDPSQLVQGQRYSFYARAEDWSGNTSGGVAWDVGIDSIPPTSALNPLPGTSGSTRILMEWTGADAASGLASFQLQYQVNGGAWQDSGIQISGSLRALWFTGEIGKTYGFRLRAVDIAGNVEAYPGSAEAVTAFSACSGDALEDDDAQATARNITAGSPPQAHTFCAAADEDWAWFDALPGQEYLIGALPGSGSQAAAQIDLYKADGSGMGIHCSAAAPGSNCAVRMPAGEGGRVYIQVRNQEPAVAGNSVTYSLNVYHGLAIWFPSIFK